MENLAIETMDELTIHAHRNKWRAIMRRRIIEGIEQQFKNGIVFSDIGVIIHPGNMIDLIANYNEYGETVTR